MRNPYLQPEPPAPPQHWGERGECRLYDADTFTITHRTRGVARETWDAIDICAGCPVLAQCHAETRPGGDYKAAEDPARAPRHNLTVIGGIAYGASGRAIADWTGWVAPGRSAAHRAHRRHTPTAGAA